MTSLELWRRASAQVGQMVHASVASEDSFAGAKGDDGRRPRRPRRRSRLAAKRRPSKPATENQGRQAHLSIDRVPRWGLERLGARREVQLPAAVKNSRKLRRDCRLALGEQPACVIDHVHAVRLRIARSGGTTRTKTMTKTKIMITIKIRIKTKKKTHIRKLATQRKTLHHSLARRIQLPPIFDRAEPDGFLQAGGRV